MPFALRLRNQHRARIRRPHRSSLSEVWGIARNLPRGLVDINFGSVVRGRKVSTLVTAAPSPAIARPSRGPEWVSKTDFIRWLRCPYTWWLLECGEITLDDTLDEFQYRLIVAGTEFQAVVEASAAP